MQCYNKKLDWLFPGCRKCQAQQCFCPSSWTSPGGVGWREMRSVMEASLSLYLIIIACPYLRFPAERFSTECGYTSDLRTLLHSPKAQLFCFHSLPDSFAKTPGGGGYPCPRAAKKYRSRGKKIGCRGKQNRWSRGCRCGSQL